MTRTIPAIGAKAPAFTLADGQGRKHSLSQHAGRKVVVYFYPKDDTPGCTLEGKDFRDRHADLRKLDVRVIGVSRDTPRIRTFSLPNFACWSRKSLPSNVQPGVSSFG